MIRNDFVFDALLYLKPVERFENLVRIRRPGSCNNGTSKRIRWPDGLELFSG